jgi:hypothetical protein
MTTGKHQLSTHAQGFGTVQAINGDAISVGGGAVGPIHY